MIPWWWIIPAVVVGIAAGFLILAALQRLERADDRDEWEID